MVRQPWAALLVKGEKKAELRRHNTKISGWVGVAVPGKKQRVGDIYIGATEKIPVGDVDPSVVMTSEDHIKEYAKNKTHLYLWHVVDSRAYESPLSFKPSQGAVVWAFDKTEDA
jgi:hypothetical protein